MLRSIARLSGCCAVFAMGLSPSISRAQDTPPPPPSSTTRWVWTTLPALADSARIEAFSPREKGTDPASEADDANWRTVCKAPCAQWMAAGARLRVNGDFRVGAPFTLPSAPAATLAVSPASPGAGIALMGVGGGVAAVSGFVYLVSSIGVTGHGHDDYGKPGKADERRNTRLVAGTFVGLGLATVGAGLVLLITNLHTTVDVRPGRLPPHVPLARGFSLSPDGLHF